MSVEKIPVNPWRFLLIYIKDKVLAFRDDREIWKLIDDLSEDNDAKIRVRFPSAEPYVRILIEHPSKSQCYKIAEMISRFLEDKGYLTSQSFSSDQITEENDPTDFNAHSGCKSYFLIEQKHLKRYVGNKSGVEIPSNVLWILPYAFRDCKRIQKVIVPDSTYAIYEHAFHNCENLETAFIGKRVMTIDPTAFDGCSKLRFCVDEENSHFISKDGALYAKHSGERIFPLSEKEE